MATTQLDNRPKLTQPVQQTLSALRTRIRLYVWVEGLASVVVLLGVAFWLSLAVDWFFEPSVPVRRVVLSLVGMAVVYILVSRIGRRAFVRLTDANMATLLERRFSVLDDALLTAVILSGRESDGGPYNQTLLEQTCSQAAGRIGQVRLGEVFNPTPLRRSLTAAILLGISIGVFWAQCPAAFSVWTERTILLGEGLWPRRTRLSVEGFENRTAKVARGSDFTLVARADMMKELVPNVVEVRYRAEGGARNRATMSRLGNARKGIDAFQQYSHTFQGVLAPIRFDVVGGDDRLSGLRIEVVDSPTISELLLDCKFPAYMDRRPRTLPHVGAMQLPRGTRITARAVANKDLTRVQIDTLAGEETPSQTVLSADEMPSSRRDFQYALPPLAQDMTLLFTLSDTDGITAREPVRLPLVVVEDQPPQLAVRLDGIGPAVTPAASLPTTGRITDDHGVGEMRFVYTVDDRQPEERSIDVPDGDTTDVSLATVMNLADLKLAAGQKLSLLVEAVDRYDLEDRPNVGSSDRWTMDIVTPEQLRVMLESRELVLRQRFERIVEEVVESRDLLIKVESSVAAAVPDADDQTEPAVASPSDAVTPAPRLTAPSLRVQQVIQGGRKSAHEIRGIAASFDDIRLQLINNHIDTEPLKERLKDRIADPLRHIAETRFPDLERQLGQLREYLDKQQRKAESGKREDAPVELPPSAFEPARQEIDAILLELRRVLDSMIELEDFNEAVELLREIIRLQKELNEETRERHKDTLRQLMEGL